METTLITAGIACVIAAIVGGGLKAFAIEIRVLDSVRRQAALGAFGVLLIAAGLGWNRFPRVPGSSPSDRPPSEPPATADSAAAVTGCSPAWFRNPPPARVKVMESGTADGEVLPPDQPKDGPVVIVLTENGTPVGAIAFQLYVSNDLFKITQVVDARCQPVETFRNESRGGDRHVLQNYDTVELTFGTRKYSLSLGYGAGTISGRLIRTSAADTAPLSSEDCLAWFRTPPPDGVTVLEAGTANAEVLRPDQPKDRPLVIVLAEHGQAVGAVAFRLYISNDLFKITHVVSPTCESLETFRNESRGGDHRVLQNYDTAELTFGSRKYALRLGYGSGSISGQLDRV